MPSKITFDRRIKELLGPSSSTRVFLCYLFFTLTIGCFVRDIPNQPDIFSNVKNFYLVPLDVMKLGDSISFTIGAKDIYEHGWLQDENLWLVRLWPPGFILLESIILRIGGLDTPFIFVLVLLNSLLVSFCMLLIRNRLAQSLNLVVAGLLPIIPFLFPVTRLFLLQPAGVILGESFSIIFFLCAAIFLLNACQKSMWGYAIASGLFLALSAYFRSQYELVILAMTLITLLTFMFLKLLAKFTQLLKGNDRRNTAFIALTVSLLTAHATMMPWRVFNYTDPYVNNFSWVQTSQLIYKNAGMTDISLNAAGGGWLVEGGSNLACKLDQTYCEQNDKERFYEVFIKNMSPWLKFKINLVDQYWFSSLTTFMSPGHIVTITEVAFNFCLMIVVLFMPVLLWRSRRHTDFLVLFVVCSTFYASNFAIFTLIHFETRYFYSLKIVSLFFIVILFAVIRDLARVRDRDRDSTPVFHKNQRHA